MVKRPVRCNHTPPDCYFIGEPDWVAIEIGDLPSCFSTDEHPGSGISYPKRSTQVNEPINSSTTDITELKSGCPKEAPPSDLLPNLHHAGGVKFPAIHAHCTFIEM